MVLLAVFAWPGLFRGWVVGAGPDETVYLWWARVGASEGISLVGRPPGRAGADRGRGGHPGAAARARRRRAAAGARRGDRARLGRARVRTGSRRPGRVDARGADGRHLRRASRRRVRGEPRLHGHVPHGGRRARPAQPARGGGSRAAARRRRAVAPAVLPRRRRDPRRPRPPSRGCSSPSTAGGPTRAGCSRPLAGGGLVLGAGMVASLRRARHGCRSTRRRTVSCDARASRTLSPTTTSSGSAKASGGSRPG